MKELINKSDKYKMNWVAGHTEWGTVKTCAGLSVSKNTQNKDDTIVETYTFTNISDKDIFTSLTDVSIYTPFNDDYPGAEICMTSRCSAHIWCGDDVSYVMALRMGGEPPHLGLVLTHGSLGGYSVERDTSAEGNAVSNDRGDIILHPSPTSLVPRESFSLSWTLFWFESIDEFYSKAKYFNNRFIEVSAENYVVFEGERVKIAAKPAFSFSKSDVFVSEDGNPVAFSVKDHTVYINESPAVGEHIFQICIQGVKTHCRILVCMPLDMIVKQRCRFIAKKQQYHNENSGLDGAYLAYDNEEKHIVYKKTFDYNGGRERVAMGLLMARYLQKHEDPMLSDSLESYVAYVERELFDKETGIVYDDYQKDNSWNRLYNYPWMSSFFIELYKLRGNKKFLLYAYKALCSYYEQGGDKFYGFEIPICTMISCLEKENMFDEKAKLMAYFRLHGETMINNGLYCPKSEVYFEQLLIAASADLLLQMYRVTAEDIYLEAAEEQIKVLALLNGPQPDWHLHEAAIRHWDGYWFGKRKMLGDTFPHYWSSFSAVVFSDYVKITGDEKYEKKAEASYRNVMGLYMPDGSASAAYVYPVSVNGREAGFYEPYANDQDWGLYFMFRHADEKNPFSSDRLQNSKRENGG